LVAALAVGSLLASCGPVGALPWVRSSAATGPAGGAGTAPAPPGPPDATPPAVDTAALVGGIDHEAIATIGPARLASGLVPPTNRWYSGLVFGSAPQPVFPLPESFALTGAGFDIGLPHPVAQAAVIAAPHVPQVTVDAGATVSQIVAADSVAVTIALLDAGGARLGRVALAEGSPFVSFTADRATTLTVTVASGAGFAAGTGPAATAVVDGTTWGLVVPPGALVGGVGGVGGADGADGQVRLDEGQTATWYPVPDDATEATAGELAQAAAAPVTGVDVSYGVGDDVVRTSLDYRTADGTASAYVLAPHQRAGTQPQRTGCGLGTYHSVLGDLELCRGSRLDAFAPTLRPTGTLDLSGLDGDRRAAIVAQLRQDVSATKDFPSDTYFGGKALYRAATLVVLGEQLDASDAVADLRARTEQALREWAQPDGCTRRDTRCFVYDEAARSVIGRATSFGSEQLNDHHFHDGYLLSAAGLLAVGDPTLAADLRPVLDLLGQDIAAATATPELPQLRVFDPWAGHSWASGTAPFADGNNQESVSEAVNAWNGLGLWAQASGQAGLATEATWLASTEAAAGRTYWTDADLTAFPGFAHHVTAIVWGGKRDWATWFSPDPAAMLGIELIPMNPASGWLGAGVDPKQILAAVAEAAPNGFGVQFGDYLLAYRALAGPGEAAAAWDQALALPDTAIDDGDSRAYLLAWIAAHGG
ncbi:MAG TPA: glycosyl hydrolase, partial [Cellulomonas sp.]